MRVNKKTAPKPSVLLKKALALFGPTGSRWVKGWWHIKPGEQGTDPATGKLRVYRYGAFCSVGALNHINTPNENEATLYLMKAVSADRGETCISMLGANDAPKTKFKDIKRWFASAIKLARKDKR